jgi:hypothetical protein
VLFCEPNKPIVVYFKTKKNRVWNGNRRERFDLKSPSHSPQQLSYPWIRPKKFALKIVKKLF